MKFYSHVEYTEQHCVDNEALYIFYIISSADAYIEMPNSILHMAKWQRTLAYVYLYNIKDMEEVQSNIGAVI